MYHQYQPLVYYCGKRVIPALGVGLPTRSTVVIPALGVGLPTRSTVFSEENTLKRYRYSVWVNQPTGALSSLLSTAVLALVFALVPVGGPTSTSTVVRYGCNYWLVLY